MKRAEYRDCGDDQTVVEVSSAVGSPGAVVYVCAESPGTELDKPTTARLVVDLIQRAGLTTVDLYHGAPQGSPLLLGQCQAYVDVAHSPGEDREAATEDEADGDDGADFLRQVMSGRRVQCVPELGGVAFSTPTMHERIAAAEALARLTRGQE